MKRDLTFQGRYIFTVILFHLLEVLHWMFQTDPSPECYFIFRGALLCTD